jgi:hypothetical protein
MYNITNSNLDSYISTAEIGQVGHLQEFFDSTEGLFLTPERFNDI